MRSLASSIKDYSSTSEVLQVPNLLDVQLSSFAWFRGEGLREVLEEVSPIRDTAGKFELRLVDWEFRTPKHGEQECMERDMTYGAPLYLKAQLVLLDTGEIKEQWLYIGDIPLMTERATFVVNGAERVVVSQLVRSPGAYFTLERDNVTGRQLCFAKLIPNRGAWLELETSSRDVLSVKIDRKKKLPLTILLRAVAVLSSESDPLKTGENKELLAMFKGLPGVSRDYIQATIDRDHADQQNKNEALLEFFVRLRPGEPVTKAGAEGLLRGLFFDPRRYDLGKVGRYRLNRRLDLNLPPSQRTLTQTDLIAIVRHMILLNEDLAEPDDIDHLGNRRVRAVGELLQNQMRVGLLRMERVVRERMGIIDPQLASPSALVNVRPVQAAIREFFGGSQLSQFMDQTNPLSELTHKRRLSALGPGGLSRERAGFDVRDVHHSHYGRICPIETPEGPNIGLLGSLATYARINDYGFIETPYRKVIRELSSRSPELPGKVLAAAIRDNKGKVHIKAGTKISDKLAKALAEQPERAVKVRPFVSDETVYLAADEEEKYFIAQANARLDEWKWFADDRVEVRKGEILATESPDKIDFMDVAPKQIVSVSTSLIPFLEHDDANRALMGSNMQRQAVPLINPDAPLVGTGMERRVALDSGQVLLAPFDGTVVASNGREIAVKGDEGVEKRFPLMKFVRSNQGTCINQRPIVNRGDRVKKGQPLADSSSTQRGELALGQNVLCAFMSWEGYNFEDAIIVSEKLIKEDKYTSIHIEKFEVEARETKLGDEEITRDIPNVGEESLRDLDENGIIRVGASVAPGDILVGKVSPKGETELSAEEKLLRAIFGEKAREVKDTSLRVPHGERGTVIDVRVFTEANHSELPSGVRKMVRVWVAQTRKASVGDKMAGRHGNKGVVARILPEEDMPSLPDGTPVEVILNPIGVPSRMNLGQVLETHLGLAAKALGFKAITPVFDGASDAALEDNLARAWILRESGALKSWAGDGGAPWDVSKAREWLARRNYDYDELFSEKSEGPAREACLRIWLKETVGIDTKGMRWEETAKLAATVHREKRLAPPTYGKTILYDGRTGEPFDQPVTVGYIYMMKLIHLVEDKIHARSTGPYSLITQQPLGGKAQFGGQRFGEMEVWALEAYSAAHNLQEVLTVKSDDIQGRNKTFEAIVKGQDISQPGVPESFHVLLKELQSLGLSVELFNEEQKVNLVEDEEPLPLEQGLVD